MKLRALLALPVALAVVACSTPPEIEAENRAEAMRICAAENDKEFRKVEQERQLIKDKPYLFDMDREDFYDNFKWSFLHSDEYEDVSILQTYCQPGKNSKHAGYWYVTGYIEYLKQPTELHNGDSEVKKVISSYPTTWKE